ncbi:MAG: ATP-binding cassette domain-containing protein, partial [Deltaproteobacteria bacterium]|nr:ATP-binding cassette domain-containing protein [Deltaproteobacteria bacterium]
MADIALKLKDVHKSFGNSKIINGLDLDIFRGERHAIIGPNGAGKSTVFNLVSGFYEVSSGDIELNGKAIANLEPYLINRQGLCRSFQVTNIFPKMSVFENVRCALFRPMGYRHSFWHLCGRQKKLNEKTEEVLEKIHMSDRRDIPAG